MGETNAVKTRRGKKGIQHEADVGEEIIAEEEPPRLFSEDLLREDRIFIEEEVDFIGKMSEDELNEQ